MGVSLPKNIRLGQQTQLAKLRGILVPSSMNPLPGTCSESGYQIPCTLDVTKSLDGCGLDLCVTPSFRPPPPITSSKSIIVNQNTAVIGVG